MPTPATFQSLANRMLSGTFASFRANAVITQVTGVDYATQSKTTRTQQVEMIRTEFNERDMDGQKVKVGDYKLIGECRDLEWEPSADNTKVVHKGISLDVKGFKKDAADAAFTLHVRRE